MREETINGLVGVHIAVLESGIDLRLGTINYLLQALHNLPRPRRNGLHSAAIAGAAPPAGTHPGPKQIEHKTYLAKPTLLPCSILRQKPPLVEYYIYIYIWIKIYINSRKLAYGQQ